MAKNEAITPEEFDRRFEAGESMLKHCDLSKATRPGRQKERINVDIPRWMIEKLDRYAGLNGVARQALIKVWLAERIKAEEEQAA